VKPLAAPALLSIALAVSLAAAGAATTADGPPPAPHPVLPDTLRWASPPGTTGLKSAWMIGADRTEGPYALRVRLAAGARIDPTHPDDRIGTILSGTLYVGFGGDPAAAGAAAAYVAVPAGAVYLVPANTPHFVWARDGDVEYLETGSGPTGTTFPKAPARD
jgi:hypothetical protein